MKMDFDSMLIVVLWLLVPFVYVVGSFWWYPQVSKAWREVYRNNTVEVMEFDSQTIYSLGLASLMTLILSATFLGFFFMMCLVSCCIKFGAFYDEWRSFDSRLKKTQEELKKAQKELEEQQHHITIK